MTFARRLLGWALLAVALSASVGNIVYRGLGQQFAIFDFAAYYYAAVRLVQGHTLYPQLARHFTVGELGLYLYPPPVATAFIPFTVLPVEAASVIWAALLIALAAIVISVLIRPVDAPLRPIAAGILVISIPLQTEVANGNLTLVTLALVLAAWALRSRVVASGAVLAIALLIKLMPALLLPFLLAARRWRIAAATTLALLLVVAIGWPWLGSAWIEYLRLVEVLAVTPNVSSATHDMVPVAFAGGLGRYVLPGLALSIALYAGRLAVRPASASLAFAITVAAAPLISSFVFYPYLVLSLPLVVQLCFIARRTTVRVLALTGLLLTDLPSPPGPSDSLPLFGLLLLLAVGVVVLHGGRVTFAEHVSATGEPSEGRAAAL